MLRVIHPFHDVTDYIDVKGGRVYHYYEVGDEYPRKGAKTTEARVLELSSSYNRQGRPLIESTMVIPEAVLQEAQEAGAEAEKAPDEEISAESPKAPEKAPEAPQKAPAKKAPKKSPSRRVTKKTTGGK